MATSERGVTRQCLVHTWVVIWAHVSKTPILLIASRDPNGKEQDDFFFTTDIKMAPSCLITEFADRWSVEDTFRNVKQFLGAEELQSWKDIAPERAGAFAYLLYGVVWLTRLEHEGACTACLQREWYQEKNSVSFLDAIADLRQRLWSERILNMSADKDDHNIIQNLLVEALAWAV